jgi:serine phosphatase RsbU (regulator of sigma subunit)
VLNLIPPLRGAAEAIDKFFSFQVGIFSFGREYVCSMAFFFSLSVIMVLRFAHASRQQAVLEGEMAAAREIQQVILPEQMQAVPGFTIESEYRPAREVGGDFFQIIPHATDGSLLIVAGDVTGKGLQAGMLVALLVGAIRTAVDTSVDPEFVLRALNKRLLGRGDAGATCLALSIEKNGNATLVNAGHMPPYLNGDPVAMEGALPLGMIEGAEFSVMHFHLTDGDKLMLMSDGIVEAMDTNGHLFGFARVHELLRTEITAADVASAAQSFGQEDDISVISVTRKSVLETSIA